MGFDIQMEDLNTITSSPTTEGEASPVEGALTETEGALPDTEASTTPSDPTDMYSGDNSFADKSVKENVVDDEAVLSYLKGKGIEVEKLEDLKLSTFEDDEQRAFYEYQQKTGRGKEEFALVQRDLKSINDVDFARELVRKETGLNLSDEEVDEFLNEKLDIFISDEMSVTERVKLREYIKNDLSELEKLQIEYNTPIEKKDSLVDMVSLEDGTLMSKENFDKMQDSRSLFLSENKEAVNGITASKMKVKLDFDGTNEDLELSYEITDTDRKKMLELSNDVQSVFGRYVDSKGGFDYKSYNENFAWVDPEFREKQINAYINQAVAHATEKVLKGRSNASFKESGSTVPNKTEDGVKIVPLSEIFK